MIKAPSHGARRSIRGLSLLEVLLALSILFIGLAGIGQLIALGTKSAGMARDLARSQLLCQALMAEIAVGAVAPQTTPMTTMDQEPEWQYAVDAEPVGTGGLRAIRVTVQRGSQPASAYTLTQWVIDESTVANRARGASEP